MYSEPWAKLTMRLTPKMSDSPAATRKSELAPASPFRNCRRTAEPLLTQCSYFPIGRLDLRAVRVAPVDHLAFTALPCQLADIRTHRRLVVERAPLDRAEGRLHLQSLESFDDLLRFYALRFPESLGHGVYGGVADHRALARIVLPAFLIGLAKRPVLRGVDLAPRIAGDPPSVRGLVLQRIEVFRLAGEQVEDHRVSEQSARVPFAHELLQVGGEQRAEDGVGLRLGERLDHRAGVDLAEGRGLLGDELGVGLRLPEELLERRGGRLAVLVIRIDDGPALLLQLRRLGHKHGRLHVGGRTQPERVAVAVLPHDLVGERLGGDKQDLALGGEVGHGQAYVRCKGSHENVDPLARDQLLGHAHGIARRAAVVAHHQLQLASEHPTAGIDLLQREIHTLLVRLEEGREYLVAVQLPDLDRLAERGSSE
jgi:hypothetical protein